MALSTRHITPTPMRSFRPSRPFCHDRGQGSVVLGRAKTAGDASGGYPLTMTQPPPAATRSYSPGLEGVIAGQTSLGYVDGEQGRLLYRGYRIGDLVDQGTYDAV